MLKYKISAEERDCVEACFFEKNAKDSLLVLLTENNISADTEIFKKVYEEAVNANVKFSVCFNLIVNKYIKKDAKYTNAKIDFIECTLNVEEA